VLLSQVQSLRLAVSYEPETLWFDTENFSSQHPIFKSQCIKT